MPGSLTPLLERTDGMVGSKHLLNLTTEETVCSQNLLANLRILHTSSTYIQEINWALGKIMNKDLLQTGLLYFIAIGHNVSTVEFAL